MEVKFRDIARSLGIPEHSARISLATPPVSDEVLQYRAYCISELLINRLIQSGKLLKITGNTWAEVKGSYMDSKQAVVCFWQFNGSPQYFPFKIPTNALIGHKDAIVQRIRKLEREMLFELER